MKNKIIYLLLSFTLLFGACKDDFLDTESPSIQSSEVVFENEGMARAAIMGVYTRLSDTYV